MNNPPQATADTQTVVIERTFPHPPGKLWRALTQSRLLAQWLRNNDFEPVADRPFQFRTRGPLYTLKEWAYVGFLINLVSALIAHASIHDRRLALLPSSITTVLWALSYVFFRRRTQNIAEPPDL
jgi:hypothetical protein